MSTKGHSYPKAIILQAVYFKLRFTYFRVSKMSKLESKCSTAVSENPQVQLQMVSKA